MAWTIECDEGALKDLKKLDPQIQREILNFMDRRVASAKNSIVFGKALRHSKFGLWRYRLRDYRIICQVQKSRLVDLVVSVGHRSASYDD